MVTQSNDKWNRLSNGKKYLRFTIISKMIMQAIEFIYINVIATLESVTLFFEYKLNFNKIRSVMISIYPN